MAKVLQVSIVPDSDRFLLTNPWTASILIVDTMNEDTKTFNSWLAAYYTDLEIGAVSDWSTHDPDGDSASTLQEYLYGTDPTSANGSSDFEITFFINGDNNRELRLRHAADLVDASFVIQELANETDFPVVNPDVSDLFDVTLHMLSDGRVERRYVSTLRNNLLSSNVLYSVLISLGTPPSWESRCLCFDRVGRELPAQRWRWRLDGPVKRGRRLGFTAIGGG